VTSEVKGQGYNVMSSVSRVFVCPYLLLNKEKSQKRIKIDRKAVSATADIPHQFQGQKVKGQGHQAALPLWVAVQVTTCRRQGHIVVAALQAAQPVAFSRCKRLSSSLLQMKLGTFQHLRTLQVLTEAQSNLFPSYMGSSSSESCSRVS